MSVIGQAEGIKHGTWSGYKQHLYRKVDVCDACRAACNDRNATTRHGGQAEVAESRVRSQAEPVARRGRAPKPRFKAGVPPLPPVGNPAWGVPIYGKDLKVGDTVVHLHVDHETHVIDRFEPYKGGLPFSKSARTAYAGSWGLPVDQYSIVRILPRDGAS
ncbi:hypothetical protein [Nonomuraea sp. NPDC049709]|uniref:hypothetical protein n=1 Tax=Nonomuraea sp. NPDC049709 TaxID=3154736 RepID=UPI003435AA4C